VRCHQVCIFCFSVNVSSCVDGVWMSGAIVFSCGLGCGAWFLFS
jgi:hypothetical protein